MSALLCCGPVFHPKCLDKDPSIYNIYRWLENMLRSDELKVGGEDSGLKAYMNMWLHCIVIYYIVAKVTSVLW